MIIPPYMFRNAGAIKVRRWLLFNASRPSNEAKAAYITNHIYLYQISHLLLHCFWFKAHPIRVGSHRESHRNVLYFLLRFTCVSCAMRFYTIHFEQTEIALQLQVVHALLLGTHCHRIAWYFCTMRFKAGKFIVFVTRVWRVSILKWRSA